MAAAAKDEVECIDLLTDDSDTGAKEPIDLITDDSEDEVNSRSCRKQAKLSPLSQQKLPYTSKSTGQQLRSPKKLPSASASGRTPLGQAGMGAAQSKDPGMPAVSQKTTPRKAAAVQQQPASQAGTYNHAGLCCFYLPYTTRQVACNCMLL